MSELEGNDTDDSDYSVFFDHTRKQLEKYVRFILFVLQYRTSNKTHSIISASSKPAILNLD